MKKVILSGVLSLVICLSMIVGATYALFTSDSTTNIAATSGKVNVTAKLENMTVYSPAAIDMNGVVTDKTNAADEANLMFANGGTASNDGSKITLSGMTPGDKVEFDIAVTNQSDVAIRYRTIISSLNDKGLFAGLRVMIDHVAYDGTAIKSAWAYVGAGEAIVPGVIHVSMELPCNAGVQYMSTSTELQVSVAAVQGNASTVGRWNGTADTENFIDNIDADDKTIKIYTAEELAALAASVAEGNTYAGYTIRLMDDMDLNNREWKPIGSRTAPFSGSFDGQNHTIYNLKITKSDLADKASENRQALFGTCVPSGSTYIRDLTIQNADISAGRNVGVLVAAVDGSNVTATGNNLAISGINITGVVTVDCYLGGGSIVGSGNLSSMRDISVDVEEGSYMSNHVNGPGSTWGCVGSVQGFGYVSAIDNVFSNMDTYGKLAGIGGAFGIVGGSSDNKVACHVSNVTYTGTLTIVPGSVSSQWNRDIFSYNGLLIGTPRFAIVVDTESCSTEGGAYIGLKADGTLTSNGMSADLTDECGDSWFGAARDNNYTNKSFYKAYVSPAAE